MSKSLFAIAEHVLLDRLMRSEAPFTHKSKAWLGLYALAGFLLAIGLCFLIYASFLWMQENYSPEFAAILTGIISLLLAGIAVLGAQAFAHYRNRKSEKAKEELSQTLHLAVQIADEELSKSIEDNPKTALLISGLAGFMVGEKFL